MQNRPPKQFQGISLRFLPLHTCNVITRNKHQVEYVNFEHMIHINPKVEYLNNKSK
jgi:hypothetical protein